MNTFVKNSQLDVIFYYLHQYAQSPLMMVNPFMPPPVSSMSANNGTSTPSANSNGISSISEAPSNNSGSMLANPFHLSHLRGIQAGSFAGQQGNDSPGPGICPNYSAAGATSSTGDSSAVINSSSLGAAGDMPALLQQVTPPSDENQARRNQLLLQLLREKHNNWDSKKSVVGGNN